MNNKNENLKTLLNSLLDQDKAKELYSDITAADRIFEINPTPDIDKKIIAGIKADISKELTERHRIFVYRKFGRYAAIAALLLITAFAGLKYFTSQSGTVINKAPVASNTDSINIFDESDANLNLLTSEVEDLEQAILVMHSSDISLAEESVDELENEFNTISESEFWKG